MRFSRVLYGIVLLSLLQLGWAETSYYRGFIGDEPWQLELSIDGSAVRGRLTHDFLPLQLEAGGSYDRADNSLVARFGLAGGELSGTLLGEPDPFGTFEGSFLASGTLTPFRFEQVAQYVDYRYSQARIEATSTYPFFSSNRLAAMNSFVQPDLMAEQIEFVELAQQADLSGDIRHGWWFDSRATIEYAAPGLLSALVTVSHYTGGAHPNREYWSYNLTLLGTQHRPFDLADLFLDGSDWFSRVEQLVLRELASQEADWVVNGSINALDPAELEVFLLSPSGLQFILAPYLVGPWSAGTFTVSVPLKELEELFDPEGPVRHLNPGGPGYFSARPASRQLPGYAGRNP